MRATKPTDAKNKRQLKRAVEKILATVKQAAELGEAARKAHEEFERLTKQGASDGK